MRYSEHPYVEAFVDTIRINVVPCYDVERGNWKSAADRSPFHTEFIKESFDEEKRLETRLLKKFMKTIGVYGAEIRISFIKSPLPIDNCQNFRLRRCVMPENGC